MENKTKVISTINRALDDHARGLPRNPRYLVQIGVFDVPKNGKDICGWLNSAGIASDQWGEHYAKTRSGVEINTKGAVYISH